MNRISLFNPEHDMALANGSKFFIAPKNIREMACDLASLLDVVDGDGVLVWGWDSVAKQHLLRMGVVEELLPTDMALLSLRRCSERQSAHYLLHAFRADHLEGPYVGTSIIARDMDAIAAYSIEHEHIILKNPLSSSGKGLRHVNLNENDNENTNKSKTSSEQSSSTLSKITNWAESLIRRHGYLTAEPYYNKVQDFAMEFCVDGAGCHFVGYSLFTTNAHGRYEGNQLMEDERIESQLARYISRSVLREVRDWVIGHHHLIVPTEWNVAKHPLYFGIDMMVVAEEQGESYKLHPCVEINLRLNMGIVAHEVRRKLLAPGVEGTFHVVAFPSEEAVCRFFQEQTEKYPPVCREGKFVSGYHPLTPIHPHTRHHAYVVCG